MIKDGFLIVKNWRAMMAQRNGNLPNWWRWRNIHPSELASKGNGEIIMEVRALDAWQWMREQFGQAIRINSAYRDPPYNALIGGAPLSEHPKGRALDNSVNGFDMATRKKLVRISWDAGFTGFGGYNTFLHLDTGRARVWGQKWAWPKELGGST